MAFITGNSGTSTGAHLDFRVFDPAKGSYIDPNPFAGRLLVGGKRLSDQFQVTSPYGDRVHPVHGDRRMHHGIDYGTPEGTRVDFEGGTFKGWSFDKGGGGHMGVFGFTDANGRQLEAVMLHGSDPGKGAPSAPPAGGGGSSGSSGGGDAEPIPMPEPIKPQPIKPPEPIQPSQPLTAGGSATPQMGEGQKLWESLQKDSHRKAGDQRMQLLVQLMAGGLKDLFGGFG
jgi:hypothetical protein